MRFSACECRAEHYTRIRRSAWMKLFGNRRLYRCLACNQSLFIREDDALGSPFQDTVAEPSPARTRQRKEKSAGGNRPPAADRETLLTR